MAVQTLDHRETTVDDRPFAQRLAPEEREPLQAWVAERAAQVDAGAAPASAVVAHLGQLGLLDLGVEETIAAARSGGPSAPGEVLGSATVIGAVAGECLSSAFSLWGHRMALDYLARGTRSEVSDAVLADLRSGRRLGSSAMAAAMKQAAGLGGFGVTGRRDGDEIVLDGSITWASNLVRGAVVVTAVDLADSDPVVTWFTADADGVTVQPARGLLALDATASGRVVLEGVRTPASAVLTDDLGAFLAGCRPVLLLLQSAFCLGLAQRCLDEAAAAVGRPETRALADEVERQRGDADAIAARWDAAASDPAGTAKADLLRLRLDASHACQDATRLGVALAGGRGYVATSTAARRFREAAFLPVQSPSEGHLLWELRSSN